MKLTQHFKQTLFTLGFIAVATAITLSSVLADGTDGHGPGNGGDVTFMNGHYVSYDLAEAGLDETFEIKPSINSGYSENLQNYFDSIRYQIQLFNQKEIDAETFAIIRNRFSNLNSEYFIMILGMGMNQFQWVFTTQLSDVHDENAILQMNTLQAAKRKNKTIYLDKNIWSMMSPTNRAALVFHEIFYAFLRPVIQNGEEMFQDSSQAREVVGALFNLNQSLNFNHFMMNGESYFTFITTNSMDRFFPKTNGENNLKELEFIDFYNGTFNYYPMFIAKLLDESIETNSRIFGFIRHSQSNDKTLEIADSPLDDITTFKTELADLCQHYDRYSRNFINDHQIDYELTERSYHLVLVRTKDGNSYLKLTLLKNFTLPTFEYNNNGKSTTLIKNAMGSIRWNSPSSQCVESLLNQILPPARALKKYVELYNQDHL